MRQRTAEQAKRDRLTTRQLRSAPTAFRAEQADDGKKHISGYFATFDGEYPLWWGDVETVDRHAFDTQLGGDVRALIDHVTHLVLGRTTAGTLTLRVDDHGLWGDIIVNEQDTDAMNCWARVQRGDVTQCSFGFDILRQETEYRPDGTTHYTIMEVELYEVSVCTFPAYESTEVSARSAENDRQRRAGAVKAWADACKERIDKLWH